MADKINLSDVLTTISKLSYNFYDIILSANIQCVPVMRLISSVYNFCDYASVLNMQVDVACKKRARLYTNV